MTDSERTPTPTRIDPFARRALREAEYVILALFAAFILTTFGATIVGISGSSMAPNLYGGESEQVVRNLMVSDRVLVAKYPSWLRRAGLLAPYKPGQIVSLREPANSSLHADGQDQACPQRLLGLHCRGFYIKRVVAGPGDRVRIQRGQVIVNGHLVDDTFITWTGEVEPAEENFPLIMATDGEATAFGLMLFLEDDYPVTAIEGSPIYTYDANDELVRFYYGNILDNLAPIPTGLTSDIPFLHDILVPDGHYFVMGDNRTRFGSEDSRTFGLVPEAEIVGPATAVIWPPFRDGQPNMRALTPPDAFAPLW